MNNYLTMANNGGVIPVDTSMEYQPLNVSDVQIDTTQIDAVKRKIYDYLGINEDIVMAIITRISGNHSLNLSLNPLRYKYHQNLLKRYLLSVRKHLRIVLYLNHLNYSMQVINLKRMLLKSCYRWAYLPLIKRCPPFLPFGNSSLAFFQYS